VATAPTALKLEPGLGYLTLTLSRRRQAVNLVEDRLRLLGEVLCHDPNPLGTSAGSSISESERKEWTERPVACTHLQEDVERHRDAANSEANGGLVLLESAATRLGDLLLALHLQAAQHVCRAKKRHDNTSRHASELKVRAAQQQSTHDLPSFRLSRPPWMHTRFWKPEAASSWAAAFELRRRRSFLPLSP